jgi:hypothetical protein
MALKWLDRNKRDGARMKSNWTCIERTILDDDIIAKYARIACDYYHFTRAARLNLIAADCTDVFTAHAESIGEDLHRGCNRDNFSPRAFLLVMNANADD